MTYPLFMSFHDLHELSRPGGQSMSRLRITVKLFVFFAVSMFPAAGMRMPADGTKDGIVRVQGAMAKGMSPDL